ncbi:phosphoribosyltransferase family protein [Vibrio ostreicida]|uniref:ComF family protein n=1 Tax=Vibrio ostreicida TaxID=526588 RepID=A0ABT8BR06_9VIBR|nr:ComF family protein [Vibrio ostreicida]MDN3608545.1 ComF family protein [Vibrio ostreicida]NPD10677.1 ComF family protein [Vibrio ostreicida]
MLTEWVNKLTAKVLPNHCGLCRLPVEPDLAGSVFCAACLAYFSSQPRCQCCGLATHAVVRHCGQCLLNKPLWSRLYCVGEYQAPLSRYVHRLKDGGQYWHAKTLSSLLLPVIDRKPDMVTFVPLHWRRYCWRGYNQSQHLAWHISKGLGVKCEAVFRKTKATVKQQGMGRKQRVKNLHEAFCLRKSINAEHVAIVDDVLTTGSTVEQLCPLLYQSGVKIVDIYCICRTSEPKSR